MKLGLHFRAVIASFSSALIAELDQLVSRINTWVGKEHLSDGTHGDISVTGLTFGGETQTTVGAAGAATALPATPTGYAVFTIGTTEYVLPYYAKS
jgi:hypothetical protein